MTKSIDYKTTGTCSTQIHLEVEDGRIKDIRFDGGCNGNLQGVCALVKGMQTKEVLSRVEGIRCRSKLTSCPDQLAQAIRALEAEG